MFSKVSKLAKLLASDEIKTRKRGYKCVCELLSLEPGSNQREFQQCRSYCLLSQLVCPSKTCLAFVKVYITVCGCKTNYYCRYPVPLLFRIRRIQEESAARIAKLISTSKSRGTRSMYIKAMFETLGREWDNLDTWREDKFMMVCFDRHSQS